MFFLNVWYNSLVKPSGPGLWFVSRFFDYYINFIGCNLFIQILRDFSPGESKVGKSLRLDKKRGTYTGE